MDQPRLAALLQLPPDRADEDVHDVGLPVEVVVPHVFGDGGAGEHPLGIPEEVLEERELAGSQRDRPGAPVDGTVQQVRAEVGDEPRVR